MSETETGIKGRKLFIPSASAIKLRQRSLFKIAFLRCFARADHTLLGTAHMTCRGRVKIPGNNPSQTVLLHPFRVQFLQRFSQCFGSANKISSVIAKDLLRSTSRTINLCNAIMKESASRE